MLCARALPLSLPLSLSRTHKYAVLSGEVIDDPEVLRNLLEQKLSMQSTSVKKSFRKLDADFSGTLDRREFRRFLENLNLHTTNSCYNAVFDMLDKDGSGYVDFTEFKKEFGGAISGEVMPVLFDGEVRALDAGDHINGWRVLSETAT